MTRAATAYHGAMGDEFAASAPDSPYNAHTDRRAMLEMAGEVGGRRILDLGCGPGLYAEALLERGAALVVGAEGSETLLGHARQRLGDRVGRSAELHLHDLEEPLAFARDGSFDLVVMALTYHHIVNRVGLLGEVRRVLRPGGTLLLSTTHPVADWKWTGGDSYFADRRVSVPFGKDKQFTHTYQQMTLERLLGELLGAGFVLEELREPQAAEEARELDPRRYANTHTYPFFLALRLRRP